MMTIGQLAGIADVSVRTVRHYHAIGLLPEPARDASGYRRYGSAHLVRLLRIRALARLGIHLSRIDELLDAPESELGRELDELDAELARRAAEIASHRALIAELCRTDPRLPPGFATLLERFRDAELSEETIAAERDALVLVSALSGGGWQDGVLGTLADPANPAVLELVALAHELEQVAADDDAEIERIATAISEALRPLMVGGDETPTAADPLAATLVEDHLAGLPEGRRRVVERVLAKLA